MPSLKIGPSGCGPFAGPRAAAFVCTAPTTGAALPVLTVGSVLPYVACQNPLLKTRGAAVTLQACVRVLTPAGVITSLFMAGGTAIRTSLTTQGQEKITT